MSSTIYTAPTVNYVSKTLNGAIGDDNSTITLNNTTNMQAPGYIVIDRTNSAGTATPDNREVVSYTGISGSDLTGCTRGADGSTARAHSDGAIVETMPTVGMWNSLATIVAQAVTGDGYLRPLVSPASLSHVHIKTLLSTSGASMTGLFLNENTMASNSAVIGATQQSIKAYVDRKGIDGWTASSDTWTYASASTFTIAGVDRTTTFTKGTRLKFTQTTAKYAVVVASSFSTNTTVTIAVNTDFTIANAAITSPYYSYEYSPQGYTGWFTSSSTVSGSGGSAGTFAETGQFFKYRIDGNMFTINFNTSVTNKGSWTTNLRLAIPVTPSADSQCWGYTANQGVNMGTSGGVFYGPARGVDNYIYWKKNADQTDVQWSDMTAQFHVDVSGSLPF